MNEEVFHYGADTLSAGIALEIATLKRRGILSPEVKKNVKESREIVKHVTDEGQVVYGVTTGFGPLCTTFISKDQTSELQHNLLKSHSVGVGDYIPKKLAKLMLILKAHSLAMGYSGVTLELLERIIWHIDQDLIPCVPAQGSVGASGDLAPLAHLFLPIIGLGMIDDGDEVISAAEALHKHGMAPLQLYAKEGLALINGTQFMTAYGIEILDRFQNCLDVADIIAAMDLDAMKGSVKPFHSELHRLRPYKGNQHVAGRMRKFLEDSEILASHEHCLKVQDPYSLRCIAQVHGSSRNAWLHFKECLFTEMNAVTDNPVLLNESTIISGGNFHGQPIAMPLDYMTLAAAEIGNISDRRIYLALNGRDGDLPVMLMEHVGLNSGLMIMQYTTAALVNENKTLCFPASADSIPTSLGQEDHVSMGPFGARKALQVVENLEKILAIELICAAQGLDFRRPLKSSVYIDACHALVREHIEHAVSDKYYEQDIKEAIKIVRNRSLIGKIKEIDTAENIKDENHQLFGIY